MGRRESCSYAAGQEVTGVQQADLGHVPQLDQLPEGRPVAVLLEYRWSALFRRPA